MKLQSLGIIFFMLVGLSACGDADDSVDQKAISDSLESVDPKIDPKTEKSSVANSKIETQLFLGTGSVQGLYFPIGGVICRLLNRHKALHKVRCLLESTGGSVYNLRELRKGNFDLVVSQSDWQHHAYNGTSTFSDDGANPNLRAVFALEADPITLIVKTDRDINSVDDLTGRIVSFGYTRSLQHRIMNDLLAAKNWNDDNFKEVRNMSDLKQVKALCHDDVEAILLLMSSLNDYLKTVDESCQLRIVPIEGSEVQTLIAEKPYYRTGKIGKGQYLNAPDDIMSFGLGATFVASESTSPKAIYHVVKEIVENFRDFQSLHPSLQHLEKKELPYAGISVPLHSGAIRYYKEARLLK